MESGARLVGIVASQVLLVATGIFGSSYTRSMQSMTQTPAITVASTLVVVAGNAAVTKVAENISAKKIQTEAFQEKVFMMRFVKNIKEIGRGSFGIVYVGRYLSKQRVVKRLFKKAPQREQDLRKEIMYLSNLKSEYIAEVYAYCFSPYCIMMEYIEGCNLSQYLHEKGSLPLKEVLRLAIEIARGVSFLHNSRPKVLHCNLKPSNIILDSNLHCKLTDYGLSRDYVSHALTHDLPITSSAWMAPELMEEEEPIVFSTKTDIYALGMVLYSLMTCGVPFMNDTQCECVCVCECECPPPRDRAVRAMVKFMHLRPAIPDSKWGVSWYADLIQDCWAQNAESRPAAEHVVEVLQAHTIN